MQHGFDAAAVVGDRFAADLHFHHGVAAVEVAAHFGAQRGVILAGVVVAAGGIDEDVGVGDDAVAFGEQAEQRLAGDFRHRVPHRHVDRADRDGAVAVAAGLFVAHHRGPDLVGVQVFAGLVEQGGGFGFQDAWRETLADQAALAVAAVGVEAVADDGFAVALHIGDHRDEAGGHLAEIDIGVADRGTDRLGDLADVDDAERHEQGLSG